MPPRKTQRYMLEEAFYSRRQNAGLAPDVLPIAYLQQRRSSDTNPIDTPQGNARVTRTITQYTQRANVITVTGSAFVFQEPGTYHVHAVGYIRQSAGGITELRSLIYLTDTVDDALSINGGASGIVSNNVQQPVILDEIFGVTSAALAHPLEFQQYCTNADEATTFGGPVDIGGGYYELYFSATITRIGPP